MRKLVKVVSSLVIAASVLGMGAQVASADQSVSAPKLASAEVAPSDPAIKKGQKIMVIVKDTKDQKVAVYNSNAQKTSKTVKMGSTFTAKAVKKVGSKKIVKVSKSNWLNRKDVTQN